MDKTQQLPAHIAVRQSGSGPHGPKIEAVDTKTDRLVGSLSLSCKESDCYALNVFVKPEYRRQGIADAMYRLAEQHWHVKPSQLQTREGEALWAGRNKKLVRIYVNSHNEELKRDSPTHAKGDNFEVRRSTSSELDQWLAVKGYREVGHELVDTVVDRALSGMSGATGGFTVPNDEPGQVEQHGDKITEIGKAIEKVQPLPSHITFTTVGPHKAAGSWNELIVSAIDSSTGQKIGRLDLGDMEGHWSASNVWVHPEYRRQGISDGMYKLAEQKLGAKIIPSMIQTPDGAAFWAGRKSWDSQRLIQEISKIAKPHHHTLDSSGHLHVFWSGEEGERAEQNWHGIHDMAVENGWSMFDRSSRTGSNYGVVFAMNKSVQLCSVTNKWFVVKSTGNGEEREGPYDSEAEAMGHKSMVLSMSVRKKLNKGQPVHTDESRRVVTYVMTTPDEDRDGETVDPWGGDFSEYAQNQASQDNHDTDTLPVATLDMDLAGPIPSGKQPVHPKVAAWHDYVGEGTDWPQIEGPKRRALLGNLYFSKENPKADQMYRQVREGTLKGGSISFLPVGPVTRGHGSGSHYAKWKLLEFTVCSIGSNPFAVVVAKSLKDNKWYITKNRAGDVGPFDTEEKALIAARVAKMQSQLVSKDTEAKYQVFAILPSGDKRVIRVNVTKELAEQIADRIRKEQPGADIRVGVWQGYSKSISDIPKLAAAWYNSHGTDVTRAALEDELEEQGFPTLSGWVHNNNIAGTFHRLVTGQVPWIGGDDTSIGKEIRLLRQKLGVKYQKAFDIVKSGYGWYVAKGGRRASKTYLIKGLALARLRVLKALDPIEEMLRLATVAMNDIIREMNSVYHNARITAKTRGRVYNITELRSRLLAAKTISELRSAISRGARNLFHPGYDVQGLHGQPSQAEFEQIAAHILGIVNRIYRNWKQHALMLTDEWHEQTGKHLKRDSGGEDVVLTITKPRKEVERLAKEHSVTIVNVSGTTYTFRGGDVGAMYDGLRGKSVQKAKAPTLRTIGDKIVGYLQNLNTFLQTHSQEGNLHQALTAVHPFEQQVRQLVDSGDVPGTIKAVEQALAAIKPYTYGGSIRVPEDSFNVNWITQQLNHLRKLQTESKPDWRWTEERLIQELNKIAKPSNTRRGIRNLFVSWKNDSARHVRDNVHAIKDMATENGWEMSAPYDRTSAFITLTFTKTKSMKNKGPTVIQLTTDAPRDLILATVTQLSDGYPSSVSLVAGNTYKVSTSFGAAGKLVDELKKLGHRAEREKSMGLWYHNEKAINKGKGQPCKQGEAAARSGCIPASGGGSSKPTPAAKPAKPAKPVGEAASKPSGSAAGKVAAHKQKLTDMFKSGDTKGVLAHMQKLGVDPKHIAAVKDEMESAPELYHNVSDATAAKMAETTMSKRTDKPEVKEAAQHQSKLADLLKSGKHEQAYQLMRKLGVDPKYIAAAKDEHEAGGDEGADPEKIAAYAMTRRTPKGLRRYFGIGKHVTLLKAEGVEVSPETLEYLAERGYEDVGVKDEAPDDHEEAGTAPTAQPEQVAEHEQTEEWEEEAEPKGALVDWARSEEQEPEHEGNMKTYVVKTADDQYVDKDGDVTDEPEEMSLSKAVKVAKEMSNVIDAKVEPWPTAENFNKRSSTQSLVPDKFTDEQTRVKRFRVKVKGVGYLCKGGTTEDGDDAEMMSLAKAVERAKEFDGDVEEKAEDDEELDKGIMDIFEGAKSYVVKVGKRYVKKGGMTNDEDEAEQMSLHKAEEVADEEGGEVKAVDLEGEPIDPKQKRRKASMMDDSAENTQGVPIEERSMPKSARILRKHVKALKKDVDDPDFEHAAVKDALKTCHKHLSKTLKKFHKDLALDDAPLVEKWCCRVGRKSWVNKSDKLEGEPVPMSLEEAQEKSEEHEGEVEEMKFFSVKCGKRYVTKTGKLEGEPSPLCLDEAKKLKDMTDGEVMSYDKAMEEDDEEKAMDDELKTEEPPVIESKADGYSLVDEEGKTVEGPFEDKQEAVKALKKRMYRKSRRVRKMDDETREPIEEALKFVKDLAGIEPKEKEESTESPAMLAYQHGYAAGKNGATKDSAGLDRKASYAYDQGYLAGRRGMPYSEVAAGQFKSKAVEDMDQDELKALRQRAFFHAKAVEDAIEDKEVDPTSEDEMTKSELDEMKALSKSLEIANWRVADKFHRASGVQL